MNNPKERQQWIYEELIKAPNKNYVEMWASYGQKWAKGKTTFDKDWNKANESLKQYQEQVNNAKIKASINEEVKAVKIGLKSKIDRLLILQKLVDECLEQLATKQCNDTIIIEGTVKNIKRLMNQRELNDTRKTLQSLQSEISKIEGDYAVAKTENININIERQPMFGDLSLDE